MLALFSQPEPRDQQGRGCQAFLTRGQGQGSSPGTSQGGHKPECSRKEGQADACTILALGWGSCWSNSFLPLLPTLGRP